MDLLRNHPYFIKENGKKFYFRNNKDDFTYLIIVQGFGNDIEFPIVWDNEPFDDEFQIWDADDWFKDLFLQVNKEYYYKNRVKMAVNGYKRGVVSVLYFSILYEEHANDIFELLENMETNEIYTLPIQYKDLIFKFKVELEKEGYKVSTLEGITEMCIRVI